MPTSLLLLVLATLLCCYVVTVSTVTLLLLLVLATTTKDLPTAPETSGLTGDYSCLDTPQQRHQESFCYGYAFRDLLGKYAKNFPRGLGALHWCSLEAERVM